MGHLHTRNSQALSDARTAPFPVVGRVRVPIEDYPDVPDGDATLQIDPHEMNCLAEAAMFIDRPRVHRHTVHRRRRAAG